MLKRFVTLSLTVLLVSGSLALAGTREIILSAAIPGLGQLYGGSRYKGLGFMAAEIVAVHLYFNNLSLYNSLCQDTRNIYEDMRIEKNKSYERMTVLEGNWRESYDNAQDRKGLVMPLLGAVAGVWVLNLADVIVFPPARPAAEPSEPGKEDDLESLRNSLDYRLALKNNNPHVMVTYKF